MRKSLPWFGLAAAIVAADQLVKWVVLARFAPGEGLEVTGFFNLVLVFNKGAAFSLLAREAGWQTPLLVAFAFAAAGIVSFLIFRNPQKDLLCAALAAILGGALGNVIDRLRFGHVVDFLDFHALGWHFPAFNVADSAITIGAVLLIAEGFIRK
jgi:signal peptidase II